MINHQFDNDMSDLAKMPADLKVLVNHIYEYQKGVRPMLLFTCKKQYEEFATSRLANQDISFITQPVGNKNINIFFGKEECINAIKLMVNRPLNQLSPEEDFILGALLGYDIRVQCERYCKRKCDTCTKAQ